MMMDLSYTILPYIPTAKGALNDKRTTTIPNLGHSLGMHSIHDIAYCLKSSSPSPIESMPSCLILPSL